MKKSRQKNRRNLLFVCMACDEVVFRKTKDVDMVNKFCAKCSRQFRNENGLSGIINEQVIVNNIDNVDVTPRSDPDTLTVPEELSLYRRILDYLEELHQEQPNATFLDLYLESKEHIRI